MNLLWTWGGIFFGYIEGENLWTCDGRHVGKLRCATIFGADGHYLGELRNRNRLISQVGEQTQSIPAFTPFRARLPGIRRANAECYPMPETHVDFPLPEAFTPR